MAVITPTPWKGFEIGVARKRDGKLINITLFDALKSFSNVDFVNNEVKINGETIIADSFRTPYYETKLSIVKETLNGGYGSYRVNDHSYENHQDFSQEKGSEIIVGITPSENSILESVKDETGKAYELENGSIVIDMTADHTLTIVFNTVPPQQ